MTDNKVTYRIFLSSPGDVNFERNIVRQEIQNIFNESEFSTRFECEIVSWDDPDSPSPLLANQTPQTALRRQLVEPADCDLVIVIFWSRMGTPLPKGQYSKANGEPYHSGTEWEFENALNSPSKPNILLYRRIDLINLDPDSIEYDSALQQQGLVNQFFKRFSMNDGALKGLYQKYKGTSEFREQLRQDLQGILRLDVAEGAANSERIRDIKHKPIWRTNPYVGLTPYDEKHADVFFGREREIQWLEEKVANSASCIAVVGSTGAGKSSLVLAGLVSRLKNNTALGGGHWICKTTKPSNPNFLNDFSSAKTQQDINNAIDQLLVDTPSSARMVMVVDQAEELLKLSKESIPFFVMILNGLIQCPRVTLILTCRTDLYGDFVEISDTELQSYLQENTFMLSAPRTAEMINIIRKPAQAAGIVVDDVVVGKILEKFEGNSGSLPLVSFLLRKLYDTVSDKQLFDLQAYEAAGGVEGVIKASAENIYTSLSPHESAKFSDVFSRLLSIDKYDRVTREHCALSVFQKCQEMESLINAFVKARLLTITEDDSGTSTVEIAHESLIHNWPSLASLAQERSSQIKWRQSLREGAHRWKDGGMSDARLIQGDELDKAIQIMTNEDFKLESVEKEFFEASKVRRLGIEKKIRRMGALPLVIIFLSIITTFYITVQIYSDTLGIISKQAVRLSQNYATSLSFAVNQSIREEDIFKLKVIVDAAFDSGDYESIRIEDREGKVVIDRNIKATRSGLMNKLISTPQAETGTAMMMSGWNPAGRTSVRFNTAPMTEPLAEASLRVVLAIVIFLIIIAPVYLFSLKALRRLRKSVF